MLKPVHMVAAIALAACALVMANCLFIVDQTHVALVLNLGKVNRVVMTPGLYIHSPFVENVVQFDSRILAVEGQQSEIVTKDKKRLVVDTFMRWRISDPTTFYETQRTIASADTQLLTIMSAATKRTLARFDLQHIISGERQEVMADILNQTREEAGRLGIKVVDVRIRRADLPQENSLAVYNRMRAERAKEAKQIRAQGAEASVKIRAEADRKKTVLLAQAEQQAQTLKGQGDGEATTIYAAAYDKDPKFYAFTKTLDAYKQSLARSGVTLVVDPKTDFLKLLGSANQP